MWRDVILANLSAMLPCTGAARSSSYRGAKILGKSGEPWTKLNFGLAVHSLTEMQKQAQNARAHKIKLLFPSSKRSNAKMHKYSWFWPWQHPQTRLLPSLLWKRWNYPYERYFSHQWAVAAVVKSCPIPRGDHWRIKAHRELPSGCLALKFIFYCSVVGGEGVNSTSQVLQCSIFLFLAHHIQLAFYFTNYLYR